MAGAVALGLALGSTAYAANDGVRNVKPDGTYDSGAPTAILIEASSGRVLFEKNADELRAPSSMMQLMAVEVVFDAIRKGDVKLTDQFTVSENAWRKGGAPSGGSTMFAALHSRISIDDLLHGSIILSGNDASIVLAEGIAGNDIAFAEMMTKRARQLGMTQSTFANSNGLPDPGNKMTVRELAKLARHVIQTYPEFYKLFGKREFTWNKIRQPNRNPLLASLDGADGLKTGYTKEGGYGMVGSAVQKGMRLIVAINGLDDPDDRAAEAKNILEWGFRSFDSRIVSRSDQPFGSARPDSSDSVSQPAAAAPPLALPTPQASRPAGPTTEPAISRRVALVVGNSSYKSMPALINPKNDAIDVARALNELGFETVLASDLDRAGMNAAVDKFSRVVARSDIAVVYYAGHGMQFQGKNYLLPVDANLESVDDVNRFRLMPVDDIVEVLGSAKGLQLLVLDACRNNPVEREFKNRLASAAGGNRDVETTRGFSRIEQRGGLVVAYATTANNVAADGDGRNSPFTKAFLKYVATPDLEVRQMLNRVQSEVFASTEKRQLPEISSLYAGPDILLKPVGQR